MSCSCISTRRGSNGAPAPTETGLHRHLIKKAGVGELTSKVTATDNPYRSPVRCRDHLGVVVRHIAAHDVYVRTRSRQLPGWCAEGVVIVHHPAQPWRDPAALGSGCRPPVSAETLPPDHVDGRLDLRYAVGVLMAQAA